MKKDTIDRCAPRPMRIATAMLVSVIAPAALGQVTVGSLADELADRDALTVFPAGPGAYTQHQASSHDTRNGTSNGSRLGGAWGFENVDFGNYIRRETHQGRDEFVLFEDSGPGAITRWWTTGINDSLLNNNNFRIYIDGNTNAAYTGSASNLVGGNNNGFGSQLNFGTPARGGNTYGPITYSSGVKVTWDGPATHGGFANINEYVNNGGTAHNTGNALWYNINYRKYEPGTAVESYTGAATATYASQLGNANNQLAANAVQGHVGSTDTQTNQSIGNGAALTRNYTAPSGAGNGQAIREITLKLNGGTGAQQRAALAGTFVELTFDGQETARVPIDQFFGNGWSESNSNVYNEGGDYFRSVAQDGTLTSRWVMPYQNDAQVRIVNESGQAVNVDLEVKTGDYTWTSNSMHFHADYRADNGIRTRDVDTGNIPSNERYSAEGDADFRFIDIRGRGVYVGDTMSIRNRNIGSSASPDFWWGEGDEKIYIDYLGVNGDGSASTPDHVGTGTEDYYGYSFGSSTEFESAFVSQPIATAQRDATGSGLTVQGRVRGLDAITFEQSLKFDMEVWKWRQGSLDLGAATFWYGAPGSASMQVAAELATDFKRHTQGISNGDQAAAITDSAGDGSWAFFTANAASSPTDTQVLTWGDVGNAGNQGFGGGENADGNNNLNLGAISDRYIFSDGGDNIGVQGRPGYRELALHPAGDGAFGNTGILRDFLVARWEAGASSEGLININGSIRNLVDNSGDSIEFYIFVDGVQFFSVNASGTTLEETYFDFDATVLEGQHVDFVLGDRGNNIADEAILRATILALGDTTNNVTPVPEPGSLGLLGLGGLLACTRRRRRK